MSKKSALDLAWEALRQRIEEENPSLLPLCEAFQRLLLAERKRRVKRKIRPDIAERLRAYYGFWSGAPPDAASRALHVAVRRLSALGIEMEEYFEEARIRPISLSEFLREREKARRI